MKTLRMSTLVTVFLITMMPAGHAYPDREKITPVLRIHVCAFVQVSSQLYRSLVHFGKEYFLVHYQMNEKHGLCKYVYVMEEDIKKHRKRCLWTDWRCGRIPVRLRNGYWYGVLHRDALK